MAITVSAASSLAKTSISGLAAGATAIGAIKNLLLASPQGTQGYQPQNASGPTGLISTLTQPPGILFHYEGEQTASLQSDITDHFIEDNTAIQDQIALKPVTITTHGFIGELNNVPPPALAILQSTANLLVDIGSYVPGLSATALIAYANAFAAYQLAQNAVNASIAAVSSITGTSGEGVISSINGTIQPAVNQNKQQTYFQQFYGYWQNRTLFTLQTPWAVFQNMAILTLRAIQDSETRMITDFEVTFKQINVASTSLLGPVLQAIARASSQSAAVQGNGTSAQNPSIGVAQGLSKMGAL